VRHARTLSLCLLGALAFAAVASSSASAKLPEWGQCRATASGSGGKYANPGCTQPVKKVYGTYPGGYEWYPLARSAEEVNGEEETNLQYNGGEVEQPDRLVTYKFASGREIQCSSGLAQETEMPLDGANVVTDAPLWTFGECTEPVLALENHGEPGPGGSYPGSCHSTDGLEGQITTEKEWRKGLSTPPRGTTWFGKTGFLGSKTSSTPSVGVVYKADPAKERFYQQILCESGGASQPLSIQIGGHKGSERIVAEVTPVNAMAQAHTVTLHPQSHDTTEALVNTGAYEPVAIEASMYFPAIYIGYEQRLAGFQQPGTNYENELELKASP